MRGELEGREAALRASASSELSALRDELTAKGGEEAEVAAVRHTAPSRPPDAY